MTVFVVEMQPPRIPDHEFGSGVTATEYNVNGFRGLLLDHLAFGVKKCSVAVNFDTPSTWRVAPSTRKWRLESENPFTIAGIITCERCNLRGRIYEGTWESVD